MEKISIYICQHHFISICTDLKANDILHQNENGKIVFYLVPFKPIFIIPEKFMRHLEKAVVHMIFDKTENGK